MVQHQPLKSGGALDDAWGLWGCELTSDTIVTLVLADTFSDLIVDLLQRVEGSARQNATRETHEMISALSAWAATQGAVDVSLVLKDLEQQLEGKAVPNERVRLRLISTNGHDPSCGD